MRAEERDRLAAEHGEMRGLIEEAMAKLKEQRMSAYASTRIGLLRGAHSLTQHSAVPALSLPHCVCVCVCTGHSSDHRCPNLCVVLLPTDYDQVPIHWVGVRSP